MTNSYIPLELVFLPMIGYHLAYFLISLSLKKSYHTDNHVIENGIYFDYQTLLRAWTYFTVTIILLWNVASIYSVGLGFIAALCTVAIDYWYRRYVPYYRDDLKRFLTKGGMHHLFYNAMFTSLVCSALAIHNLQQVRGA